MLCEDNLLAGAVSKQSFGDFFLHLEFLTGFQPDAVFSVRLNGHRVVDQQSVKKTTAQGAKGCEKPTGPVWIDGFGRRVLDRNIWVLERPEGGDREKAQDE